MSRAHYKNRAHEQSCAEVLECKSKIGDLSVELEQRISRIDMTQGERDAIARCVAMLDLAERALIGFT